MQDSTIFYSACLLTIFLNIVPIQPAHSLEGSSAVPQSVRIRKRSFSPWSSRTNTISLYEAGNAFKPPTYSLPRPYYIPVYGVQGNLLFYPPQPLYVNPGTPYDNPVKRPFQGPSYLPPIPPKETNTQMMTMNRFGDDDGDDDAPIWGNGDMVQMPLSGDQEKESSVIPTRPPMSSMANRPPLVHDQSAIRPVPPQETSRPAQNIPRPQTITTQRPPFTQAPAAAAGPSNCVWAIISCCSTANPNQLSQSCFEQRGCPGPFWGDSPCNSDFARAAIAAAVNYYSSNPSGAVPGK